MWRCERPSMKWSGLAMPPALWRTLELASVLMGFDADVLQAPLLQLDP